jgi:hypothetical protein
VEDLGIPIPIAESDCVAEPKHDVVGAGAAHDRLMEVIAHRVVVQGQLQIGSSPLMLMTIEWWRIRSRMAAVSTLSQATVVSQLPKVRFEERIIEPRS